MNDPELKKVLEVLPTLDDPAMRRLPQIPNTYKGSALRIRIVSDFAHIIGSGYPGTLALGILTCLRKAAARRR